MASSIDASTSGAGGVITTADNTGILNLQTAGTTAVTVNASQNVGIGTATPAAKLQVAGTTFFGATSTGAVGIITPDPTSGANGVNIAASFASGGYGPLTFSTNNTERMRIDSSGNVLINTTTNNGPGKIALDFDSGSNFGLSIRSTNVSNNGVYARFYNSSNAQAGQIVQTAATTVSYATSSDYRLKEDVKPMIGALEKVAQLKPVTYKWKIDGSAGQGFIAHELQSVIPDCVVGEKDAVDAEGNPDYQGIDTSFLVATLTAAIQEQQTIINDLKARVTALEAK